jgi:hypothetical protein
MADPKPLDKSDVASNGPSQSGTMTSFVPQWKNSETWGDALNKRLGYEGGKDWQNIPVSIIRGGVVLTLPDGREIPFGIPFPRIFPGILETIHQFGYEQAHALAWCFAAQAGAVGATIEIRVKEYRLDYSIKTKELSVTGSLGKTCE